MKKISNNLRFEIYPFIDENNNKIYSILDHFTHKHYNKTFSNENEAYKITLEPINKNEWH